MILLLLFGILLQTTSIDALVTARFSASEARPLTGEPFHLELIISLPPQTELAEAPQFDEQWGDFDIRDVSPLEHELLPDGTQVYRQMLTVILWRPRDYNTPDSYVGYRLTGFEAVQRVPVRGVSLTVPTVIDADDATLRPFKPLVDLPYVPWWAWMGVGAAVILVAWAVYRGWGWLRRASAPTPWRPPDLSPDVLAVRQLDVLAASTQPIPEIYAEVVTCLQGYIGQQYGIDAVTTDETLSALAAQGLAAGRLAALHQLFIDADLVKFAGVQPEADAVSHFVEAARQWILAARLDEMVTD